MESKYKPYNHIDSDSRIQEILNSSESFEEVQSIPSRDRLTYNNGFYVNCTALFIDIRGSSELPMKHKRPVLGKIYRSYLSECVAIMNGNNACREVFINGDCVSGIFDTPRKSDIDSVFLTACILNSVVNILNWRLEKKGYSPIKCGIGMDYGRALMLKAGYKGSGINDVIWMGDVVNSASNLCHQANKFPREPLLVSADFYQNLNDHNKGLLNPVYCGFVLPSHYEGNVVHEEMKAWLNEQREKENRRQLSSLSIYK